MTVDSFKNKEEKNISSSHAPAWEPVLAAPAAMRRGSAAGCIPTQERGNENNIITVGRNKVARRPFPALHPINAGNARKRSYSGLLLHPTWERGYESK